MVLSGGAAVHGQKEVIEVGLVVGFPRGLDVDAARRRLELREHLGPLRDLAGPWPRPGPPTVRRRVHPQRAACLAVVERRTATLGALEGEHRPSGSFRRID